MRQRRALRQFTLSTGKSAGRNSSGRIKRGNRTIPIMVRIDIVMGLLVTLLSNKHYIICFLFLMRILIPLLVESQIYATREVSFLPLSSPSTASPSL